MKHTIEGKFSKQNIRLHEALFLQVYGLLAHDIKVWTT